MAATKSKSRNKGKDTVHDEASVQSSKASTSVATKREEGKHNMSEAPSILSFSEDVTDAPAPVPLPVGDYPVEIRGAAVKTSQKGNRYVSVQFFVAPENYPADYTDGNPEGEVLSYNRLQYDDSPRGRHRVRKFCEAIGAKTGKDIDVNDWVGLTAVAAITEEEWEGEPRAVISKIVAA